MPTYSIAQLNQLDQDHFTAVLGGLFEQTPEIARRVWLDRPFSDRHHLHQCLARIVIALSDAEQIRLILAHPDLGSRLQMAEASVKEQAGVGLDRLTPEEYKIFERHNQQYQANFQFPFIIAVRNHSKTSILQAFEQRLQNDRPSEQSRAIAEILEIARWRLGDIALD
jgi:2-oxo-4-hydroxy-4-carboxy-5-ureidoimidazoline decarboxylase